MLAYISETLSQIFITKESTASQQQIHLELDNNYYYVMSIEE